jgi:hypothetical protein
MWEWMKKALYKGLSMNGGSVQEDCGFGVAMAADGGGGAGKRRGRRISEALELRAWKPVLEGCPISENKIL